MTAFSFQEFPSDCVLIKQVLQVLLFYKTNKSSVLRIDEKTQKTAKSSLTFPLIDEITQKRVESKQKAASVSQHQIKHEVILDSHENSRNETEETSSSSKYFQFHNNRSSFNMNEWNHKIIIT